jgi:hypothetical protein
VKAFGMKALDVVGFMDKPRSRDQRRCVALLLVNRVG